MLNGGVEVAEVFVLCENHIEVLTEVATMQGSVNGLALRAGAGRELQKLRKSMQEASKLLQLQLT